jgi:hypothetical protein
LRAGAGVGSHVIVESPVPHPLAQHQEFDRLARIAAMGHHAVEGCELLMGLPPFAIAVSNAYTWTVAKCEGVRPAQSLAGPQAFGFDLRVAREPR